MADATALTSYFTDPARADETLAIIAQVMGGVFVLAWVYREVTSRVAPLDQLQHIREAFTARPYLKRIGRILGQVVLVGVAVASAVTYFYGSRGAHVHKWDTYHTVIGAKYFDELGYFETYRCSIVADNEGPRDFRKVKEVRDLHTRKHVKLRSHLKGNDCRNRFSDERWQEFKTDLELFSTWTGRSTWPLLFRDKGFNGTPSYTWIVRSLLDLSNLTKDWIFKLTLIDPVLMLGAFCAIAWAFGLTRAALVATCFCTIFPNRFIHMGGSILRFDYVALSIIALCAMRKNRWGLAGFCLAWATMVRVFPLFFATGVFLKILVEFCSRRQLLPGRRAFVLWYAATCTVLLGCSLIFLDDGVNSWLDWFEDMRVHNMKSAGFRIGFRHLFMFDGELGKTHFGRMQDLFEERRAYYFVAMAALYAPYLLAIRRLDFASFSALFGLISFFMLTVATRYYYGVMALVLLVNRDLLRNRYMILLGAMLFFASAIDFSYYARNSYDAFMYNQILSVQFAVLFAVLGSWLLFNPSLKDPARRSHGSRSFHPRVPIKDGLPSLDLAHAQAAPSESEPTTSLAAGETAPPTTNPATLNT